MHRLLPALPVLLLALGCSDTQRPRAGLAADVPQIVDDAGDVGDVAVGVDVAEQPDVPPQPADAGRAEADGGPADAGRELPPGKTCWPGEQRCLEGRQATCLPSGLGWQVEACAEGLLCVDGACEELDCVAGMVRCDGEAVQRCEPETLEWSQPRPCEVGEVCVRGVCIPRACEPGDQLCDAHRVLTCEEDGLSWAEEPCPEGWVCFAARCVACLRDADCGEGLVCHEDTCVASPLAIQTDELPDGMVGEPYDVALLAEGGTPPYRWSLAEGPLPGGLALAEDGRLAGTPDVAGDFALRAAVLDADGQSAEVALALTVHGPGLVITTDELPAGEDGFAYEARLEALGGSPPYAWMIAEGALPAGLSLLAGGMIQGTPSEIGEFPLSVRVFDTALPPGWDARDYVLSIQIAPLEIVGEQEFDLFLFKIITLPLITVVEGLPLPYETQLTARGGLRPHHWTEVAVPDGLRWLLPRAGIPDGLELAEDGTLSGAVDSTEQVVSIEIPFTQITLHGFFFTATVEDSQEPAESRTAVFLLPTLPVGGP